MDSINKIKKYKDEFVNKKAIHKVTKKTYNIEDFIGATNSIDEKENNKIECILKPVSGFSIMEDANHFFKYYDIIT